MNDLQSSGCMIMLVVFGFVPLFILLLFIIVASVGSGG